MLTSLFAQYGKWLILLGVVIFILAVFNAFRAARNARRGYYAIRRESLTQTRQWSLTAIITAIITGVVALLMSQPVPETDAIASITHTATPQVASIATKLLPTFTATATLPPAPTATPEPTQIPTLAPTATSLPNVPDILRTPLPSAVPPADNAKLDFTTLASIVQNNNPVDPGLIFPAGTRTVRLFFRASHVNNGAVWSVLCYKGDKLVDSVVALWKWGTRAQTSRAFCGLDGSAGDYRIEAYLGSAKQFEISFQLVPPTPVPSS